jgi:transposase-like protein
MSGGSTPRAQPFYCPYCGEQDFVPFGDEAGRYCCNSCDRHFIVRFVGLSAPSPRGQGGPG